jgi:hypothetical protein
LPRCFVIMPVSTPEIWIQKYNGDREHFKHVLDYLFTPALISANYEVVPPTASGSNLIHAEIIKNLEECDLVLCDISTLNPNVFFELGIRTSLDRPVVIVRDDFTTEIPFDTISINTYTYESSLHPWILGSQVPGLTRHITEAAGKSVDHNSLWQYFGITQRAVPAEVANPTQAKLDLLIAEVAQLATTDRTTKLEDYSIEELALAQARKQHAKLERMTRENEDSRGPFGPRRTIDVPKRVKSMIFSNVGQAEAKVVIETAHALTEDIPSKYRDFIREVARILRKVDSRLSSRYDDARDLILLTSSGVITSVQTDRVAQLALNLSINYVLWSDYYE